LLEASFKFVELSLLLVKILDEATAALLHLVEAALKSYPERSLVSLAMLNLFIGNWVLREPDVMGDEFFNL